MKKDIKKASLIGAIAVVFASMLWGIDSGFLTPRLYNLDFFWVVFLEHIIAFAFMLPFFIKDIGEVKNLTIKDWSIFFFIALLGGAIGTLAITKAFFSVFLDGVSSVSVIVLLQKLQPVFAILLALIFLKERPNKKFYPLALLALTGSYLAAFGFGLPDLSAKTSVLYVPMLALLAAFCFGAGTVLGKSAVKKVSFQMATYLRFGITSLIMIVLIAIFNRFGNLTVIAGKDYLVMLIIALTTGGTAIFIYYYGLKRVMACKATIYELGFPITALVLDYFLHHTVLGIGQWFGAIVMISSIIMISRLNNKKC